MTVAERGEMRAAPAARRAAAGALAALALIGLLLAARLVASVSWNRDFQVDEVEHIHSAYNWADGRRIYADFWEGHNPLLYLLLRPVVDAERPISTYRSARAVMLAFLAGTVLLAGFAAARLAGSAAAGILAAGLLLVHSTYVERGIEVRPDGALAFCTAGALAAGLLRRSALERALVQAAFLSAGFLFTQKAVFHCTAFGCLWLWQAWRERRPALVALPVGLWTLPVAAAALVLAATDSLAAYLQYNVANQLQVVGRTALSEHAFAPWSFLRQEGLRNLFFMVASAAALPFAALRARELGFAAFLCAVLLAYLWVNPGPYPYLHVGVLPAFAVLAAAAIGRTLLAAATPLAAGAMVALCLALAASTSVPRLVAKTVPANGIQLATLAEIGRITAPDDRVFDLAGLYLRPDAYPIFVMTGIMMGRYRAGGFPPIAPALDANQTVAAILNYRIGWLPEPDARFLREHFVHYGGNILVLGTRLDGLQPGESRPFRVLKTAPFRQQGSGSLRVDGQPFSRGILERGAHVLSSDDGIASGKLILDTPEPHPTGAPPRDLFLGFD
jgi:hypothetical protein